MVTTDRNDVGTYTIDVLTFLEDYPEIETETSFEVVIDYCQVTDMAQIPVDDQWYEIHSPAMFFSADLFTQTPSECDYILDYEIRLYDAATNSYSPLPSWLTNTGDLDFSVQSFDPLIEGDYQISIIGSVPGKFMSPAYSEELIINLRAELNCEPDDVSAL